MSHEVIAVVKLSFVTSLQPFSELRSSKSRLYFHFVYITASLWCFLSRMKNNICKFLAQFLPNIFHGCTFSIGQRDVHGLMITLPYWAWRFLVFPATVPIWCNTPTYANCEV
jgi:hypothetical protein